MDDLKISHADPQEVTIIIEWFKQKYEDKVGKMKVTRGKKHTYLGMNLDFSIKGEVKIGMTEYVDDMIDKFSEKIILVRRK